MSTWEDTASREELLAFIDKLKRLHLKALDENERLREGYPKPGGEQGDADSSRPVSESRTRRSLSAFVRRATFERAPLPSGYRAIARRDPFDTDTEMDA